MSKRDRIFCESLKDYQMIKDEPGLFYKEENASIFIMAMALAFQKGLKSPFKKAKEGLARLTYLSEEQISMIKSVAIMDAQDPQVLLDEDKVYLIAEEYANAGIKLLKSLILTPDPGSVIKKLATEFIELIG